MKKYRINVTEIDEQGNENPWEPETLRECGGFSMLLVDKEKNRNGGFAAQSIIECLTTMDLAMGIIGDDHLTIAAKLALAVGQLADAEEEKRGKPAEGEGT
nr:MAG TPA: hypothetical protein [Caudoviricetes sp.]